MKVSAKGMVPGIVAAVLGMLYFGPRSVAQEARTSAPAAAGSGVVEVVPTSQQEPVTWRYTFERPPQGWNRPGFDDSAWKEGPGGFGTGGTPAVRVGTTWN